MATKEPQQNIYVVVCKESEDWIECVPSLFEGWELIKKFEEEDKKDGTYEQDFYDVVELEDCGLYHKIF